MTLTPGTQLGPYEVVGALGAGGMGEVYRARDTKLQRDVALKVLPEKFALDPARLARFRREAQILASLNHPNIAAIYGLEEQPVVVSGFPPPPKAPARLAEARVAREGGSRTVCALVLELVEGPTLADRITQGPIPLEAALPVARQIVEALAAAHEKGVIHRDLKPANIKVRDDGTVKVLDFGLAKLTEPAGTDEAAATHLPTITSPAVVTGAGALLGTAAYMAPEQARGSVADRRADLWAFGVVVWEMLTGRRLFEGATVSDTLASVLKTDPDWSALPVDTPSALRRLLRRCLEKDRNRRLDSAADARIEIDDAASRELAGADPSQPFPHRPRIAWMSALALVMVVGTALTLSPAARGMRISEWSMADRCRVTIS
ncbi:MAG: serine/threonine-protein kinase [Vicinamibacterales bacterium]